MLSRTKTDAPRKLPAASLDIAAADATPVFFDSAASTLIFYMSDGGGIHGGLPLADIVSVL
jgi:hypothetical protein